MFLLSLSDTAEVIHHTGDDMGRVPKELWAVVIKYRPEGGRLRTYVMTFHRKADAVQKVSSLVKNRFGDVSLLRTTLNWEEAA